jgi:hypothetical protein
MTRNLKVDNQKRWEMLRLERGEIMEENRLMFIWHMCVIAYKQGGMCLQQNSAKDHSMPG